MGKFNLKKPSQENAKGSVYDIIVYVMMILAVIFIIVQTFSGNFTGIGFRVSLGAWILIAVSISDFVGPMLSGELRGYDTKQMYLYVFTCVLDAVAYMCIYIFIIFVGDFKEWVHYLYLVAAVAVFVVRALVNRRIGEPHEVTESESSAVQETAAWEDEDISEMEEMGTFRSRSRSQDEE